MSQQKIECVVIYPFAGIKGDDRLFQNILDIARQVCEKPILVYDERGPKPGAAEADLRKAESKFNAEVIRTRGVDTCQNWLEG
ncbi:MAG: hypothetical protein U1F76_18445 [Candidatus Competibacteraceae bacterium]